MQSNYRYTKEVIFDKCLTREKAEHMVKTVVALYCYVKMNISLGYCSQIAGVTQEVFLIFLEENNISIFNFDSEYDFLDE